MAATLTDGALDLSAKPCDSKPSSPVTNFTSDIDFRGDRPPSTVSSDADDASSGIMSPRKRVAPGAGLSLRGVIGGYSPPRRFSSSSGGGGGGMVGRSPRASPELSPGGSVGSTPRSSPATSASPPTSNGISGDASPPISSRSTIPVSLAASPTSAVSSNNSQTSPTGTRPFKMYPFEPLPSMYSQLAAAAASQGMYGAYSAASPAVGSTPGLPSANMLDSALSFSSPIGQYLQQKRRRMEAREGRGSGPPTPGAPTGNGLTTPLSPIPGAGPPLSNGSLSGGEDGSSSDGGGSGMMVSGSGGASGLRLLGDKRVQGVPDEKKDEAYWERRRKNNEAAKRSRDARRAKEEEIALRAAFLEQENLKLRAQVAILKNETAKLHYMLYNRM